MQVLSLLDTSFEFIKDSNNQHAIQHKISRINQVDPDDLNRFDLALLGLPDNSSDENSNWITANKIRQALYELHNHFPKIHLVDLGNVKPGKYREDSRANLHMILKELAKTQIIPICAGGQSADLLPVYHALSNKHKFLNLSSINAQMDLLRENDYLHKIIYQEENKLFNYAQMAYQTCFVSDAQVKKINTLYFDCFRLGAVRNNLLEMEPTLRDTHLLEINLNAVKHADAPAQKVVSPNGLYSEEICQLAKYAGLGQQMCTILITGINPDIDDNQQTNRLAAQIIWYFIEGYHNRIDEDPKNDETEYTKFHVHNHTIDTDFEFLKSKRSGRWWVKIPYKANAIHHAPLLLSCSASDYNKASNNDIPDRIWKYYQKIL